MPTSPTDRGVFLPKTEKKSFAVWLAALYTVYGGSRRRQCYNKWNRAYYIGGSFVLQELIRHTNAWRKEVILQHFFAFFKRFFYFFFILQAYRRNSLLVRFRSKFSRWMFNFFTRAKYQMFTKHFRSRSANTKTLCFILSNALKLN